MAKSIRTRLLNASRMGRDPREVLYPYGMLLYGTDGAVLGVASEDWGSMFEDEHGVHVKAGTRYFFSKEDTAVLARAGLKFRHPTNGEMNSFCEEFWIQ